jgi:hypothetical protein
MFRREIKQLLNLPLEKGDSGSSVSPSLSASRTNSSDTVCELYDLDARDLSSVVASGSIDRVLAVNVVYFLDPLDVYARELYRVMAPKSRGILACKPKSIMTAHNSVFVNKDMNSIMDAFRHQGFTVTKEFVDLGNPIESYVALHINK